MMGQPQGYRGRFAGKGVLVTGGASGIGLATAHRFLAEGASVLVADRNATALETILPRLQEISALVRICVVDVSSGPAVHAMLEQARAWLPRLDVLISNAGISTPEDFLAISEESWDSTLAVNLKGMFLVGQAAARLMVEQGGGGAIVNTASTNGLVGEERLAHYNASKGGVVLLTKSMAIDLAPHGIRVNAVGPGFIRTPLTEGAYTDDSYFQDYARFKIPL
ncbi:MAG TPA: SDR family oxidoreductase, partial [Chloroflexota bacterium]|nr:SDR family oxidoreductase [Chloroflexota bacterium]